MSDKIYWLTWNVVLTAAMVIPYALYRMKKLGGLFQVFLTPLPGDSPLAYVWVDMSCCYTRHCDCPV